MEGLSYFVYRVSPSGVFIKGGFDKVEDLVSYYIEHGTTYLDYRKSEVLWVGGNFPEYNDTESIDMKPFERYKRTI